MLIPTHCPSCNSILEYSSVHLVCTNKNCKEQAIQRIINWVSSSEMDGMSEATIRRFWEEGFVRSIKDLYNLDYNKIAVLDGYGEKSAEIIKKAIEASRNMTFQQLISKLNIKLVGVKALKKLGIETMVDFINFKDDSYVIGQNIIEWKSNVDNMTLLTELLSEIKLKNNVVKVNSKGKVCMTGAGPKGRKELIKEIETMGYEFVDSITSDTNILIVENLNGTSSKIEKAKKLGVQLITYDGFFK